MEIRNRPNAAGSYYRALPESACRQKAISQSPVMIALNNDDNFMMITFSALKVPICGHAMVKRTKWLVPATQQIFLRIIRMID